MEILAYRDTQLLGTAFTQAMLDNNPGVLTFTYFVATALSQAIEPHMQYRLCRSKIFTNDERDLPLTQESEKKSRALMTGAL